MPNPHSPRRLLQERCIPTFIFLVVCLAAFLRPQWLQAQTPKPSQQDGAPATSAVPSPPADPQNAIQSAPDRITTIKVAVRRVVVDVTVTDAAGQPVTGLKAADFRIFEDGTQQRIRSFEVHTAEPAKPFEMPALPVNTFSNLALAPSSGPVTVILYDLLNTPLDAQAYAHAQLLQFLKQRRQSGMVAIFVLSDKLHMLQGFTDDDNRLITALNLQKAKGYRSGLLSADGEASQGSDQLGRTEGNANGAAAVQDVSFQQVAGMLKNMETAETSYLLDQRVTLTAEALKQISRFLISIPGRKNLLWLSASFPNGVLPNSGVDGRDSSTGRNEFVSTRDFTSEIVQATDLLNLAHVAVYPIDPRGLRTNSMFSAGSNQTFEPGTGKDLQAVQNFNQQQASEHNTMEAIAQESGGRAFYNTNGLKEAAQAAMQEGSLYYTLSYSPTNRVEDGKLRRIKLELNNPAYHLAYRRSYFGDGIESAARQKQEETTDSIAGTLEHGAPAAHELFFEAHIVPAGPAAQATPEQMAELVRYEAMATKNQKKLDRELKSPVLLQPYIIQYVLLPRQLDIRVGPDQARRDNLEFAAVSYNDDGLTLNGTRTQIQDVIRPERWALMQESGYHVPMKFLAPVQARSIRLAVRDVSNGHMGSLEIPLPLTPEPDAVLLPPAAAPPAAAPPAAVAPAGNPIPSAPVMQPPNPAPAPPATSPPSP